MGECEFRPAQLRDPSTDFHKTKYVTISRTRHGMQNFRELSRHGWSGKIVSLTHESFCPLSLLHRSHRSHLWTNSQAQCVIICRSGKSCVFWGQKNDIWNLTPLTPQNVTIGTFNWRSMENCTRPKSGTLRYTHLKLGTGIDHRGITLLKVAITQHRVCGRKFILGS